MFAPTLAPNYSCLLPPSLTGLTDIGDFLTQFDTVSTLSNWVAVAPGNPPTFHFCPPHRRCSHLLPVPHYCPKRRLRWTQASLPATIQTQHQYFEVPPPITWPKGVRFLPDTPWPFRKSFYRRCSAQWAPPCRIHRRVGQFCRSVGSAKS